MNPEERLNLKKLIGNNDTQETTDDIRKAKHSGLIRDDVDLLNKTKLKYARLAKTNPKEFDMMCESKCHFLYNNYTDIYNKVKKSEIDLVLLSQFLGVLKEIEDGKLDQHDGSYKIGMLLKKIYIDSALKKEENSGGGKSKKKKDKKPQYAKQKNISWAEFKAKMAIEPQVDENV
tara:strand:- start:74 stop:598 length:525 start_codon:yes stop_codon:yes gene_type:complete